MKRLNLEYRNMKEKLSTDPNGLVWSKDDNKFGQRMLEKMGWTKGKGLGSNEHGMTNHIKVSLKTDKKGIGCTVQHADKWLDVQDEFESILAGLNNTTDSQSNVRGPEGETKKPDEDFSLLEKSKNSRSRVHYTKFTRSKDLASKVTSDLNCIFGKRSRKQDVEPEKEEEPAKDGEQKSEHGVLTTISSTNLQDYFKQKMAALQRPKSDTNLLTMSRESAQLPHPELSDDADFPPMADIEEVGISFEVKNSKKKEKHRKIKTSPTVKDCSSGAFEISDEEVMIEEVISVNGKDRKLTRQLDESVIILEDCEVEDCGKSFRETGNVGTGHVQKDNECEVVGYVRAKAKKNKRDKERNSEAIEEDKTTDVRKKSLREKLSKNVVEDVEIGCEKSKKHKKSKKVDKFLETAPAYDTDSTGHCKLEKQKPTVGKLPEGPEKDVDETGRRKSEKRKRSVGEAGELQERPTEADDGTELRKLKKRRENREGAVVEETVIGNSATDCRSSKKRKRSTEVDGADEATRENKGEDPIKRKKSKKQKNL